MRLGMYLGGHPGARGAQEANGTATLLVRAPVGRLQNISLQVNE